jgi:hypothetical protein
VIVKYQRHGTGHRYTAAEKASLVRVIKDKITAGASPEDIHRELGLAASTVAKWLRDDGVTWQRKRHVGPTIMDRGAVPHGKVAVMIDLREFVAENRERIIKELCLGKREAIKTAVEEMLRL